MNRANHIVVVDDNPVLVSSLAEIFKEQGYSVRTASDGFTALAAIRDRVPDLLLSDLNMPGMSGFELLSVVRRRFPTIAVIAMSGAYCNGAIPPGIAADRFYAKGACSIGGLFKILSELEDKAICESKRAAVPIWISAESVDRGDLGTIAVGCPECLRTFVLTDLDSATFLGERRCPHCQHTLKLAIARQEDATDMSLPPLSDPDACTVEFTFAQHKESSEPPGQLAACRSPTHSWALCFLARDAPELIVKASDQLRSNCFRQDVWSGITERSLEQEASLSGG